MKRKEKKRKEKKGKEVKWNRRIKMEWRKKDKRNSNEMKITEKEWKEMKKKKKKKKKELKRTGNKTKTN